MYFPKASTATRVALASLVILLAACSKQEPQAEAFPMGNAPVEVLTVEECERLPDPAPADDSAAGRAAAVGKGMATRSECKKLAESRSTQSSQSNADLARIREIKEREQAALSKFKVDEEEWKRQIKKGGSEPVKEYKY